MTSNIDIVDAKLQYAIEDLLSSSDINHVLAGIRLQKTRKTRSDKKRLTRSQKRDIASVVRTVDTYEAVVWASYNSDGPIMVIQNG